MGFKDILNKIGEKHRARKELLKEADDQLRVQKILEDRSKSSNEREWERFKKEDREEQIKIELNEMRKNRQRDIHFNHNPLDTPNIMKAEWEVLKERNQFTERKSMFSDNEFIHKNNPNMFRNNMGLIRG